MLTGLDGGKEGKRKENEDDEKRDRKRRGGGEVSMAHASAVCCARGKGGVGARQWPVVQGLGRGGGRRHSETNTRSCV